MSVGVLLVLVGSCAGPPGAVQSKAPPPPIKAEPPPPPIAQTPPVQTPPPPPADVPQLTPVLTRFPCLNEDGTKLAMLARVRTDQSLRAERYSVWVFEVGLADDRTETAASEISWWENAAGLAPPSDEERRRLVEESQQAAAQLTSLGFDRSVELNDASETRQRGRAYVQVWKLPPFTVTAERAGARLTVRRGQRVVRHFDAIRAAQNDGQCGLAIDNKLFVTPGGDRWLIVSSASAPDVLDCPPEEPWLRVVTAPR